MQGISKYGMPTPWKNALGIVLQGKMCWIRCLITLKTSEQVLYWPLCSWLDNNSFNNTKAKYFVLAMLWGKHLLQLGIKQKQHDYKFGSWPIRKPKVHLSKRIKKYTAQANNQSTFKCQLHFNLSLSSPSVWVLSIIDYNGCLFLRQNLLQKYCGITGTMSVRWICINANTHSSILAQLTYWHYHVKSLHVEERSLNIIVSRPLDSFNSYNKPSFKYTS